jgi:hypothetical protein
MPETVRPTALPAQAKAGDTGVRLGRAGRPERGVPDSDPPLASIRHCQKRSSRSATGAPLQQPRRTPTPIGTGGFSVGFPRIAQRRRAGTGRVQGPSRRGRRISGRLLVREVPTGPVKDFLKTTHRQKDPLDRSPAGPSLGRPSAAITVRSRPAAPRPPPTQSDTSWPGAVPEPRRSAGLACRALRCGDQRLG